MLKFFFGVLDGGVRKMRVQDRQNGSRAYQKILAGYALAQISGKT